MSDTKNKSNAAIACGDMKIKEDGKGIILDQENYGPSKNEINQLAGMEIKFEEECIITNETENGEIAVIDKKTGSIIGHIDANGTINRKLEAMDKKQEREREGQDR